MHAFVPRSQVEDRVAPREPERPRPDRLDVRSVQAAQRSAGNAAVTRVLQRKLIESDERLLREYYDFLCETRDIPPGAYDKVLARIIERYDVYQDAATQLSFVLPVPARKLLPQGGLDAARDFTDLVVGLGYTPYLAGGSAITLQGGRRPAGDFDFRVDATASLKAFNAGEGQTLVNKLNIAAKKESDRREKSAGSTTLPPWMRRAQHSGFEPFKILGVEQTIGTKNFFGQEVSLTISDTTVVSHGPLATASGLSMLSLADLLRDKLKTTISRSKRGEESIKKVAQDLADGLILAELITRETSGTPELTMDALLATLRDRVPGYVVNNLELVSMQGVSTEDVTSRMLDRLVRTAHIHSDPGGARGAKFESLARGYAIDIVEHVERLASVKAPTTTTIPKETTTLEEWFSQWNKGPEFAPPKKPDNLTQQPKPVVQQPVQQLPVLAADTAIETVLAGAPDFAKLTAPNYSKDELQILYVLRRVGGFRPLDKLTAPAIQAAFGLPKTRFQWKRLKTQGLVLDSDLGLTLTGPGQQAVNQIAWT